MWLLLRTTELASMERRLPIDRWLIEISLPREDFQTPSKVLLLPFVNERINESSAVPPDFSQGSIRWR